MQALRAICKSASLNVTFLSLLIAKKYFLKYCNTNYNVGRNRKNFMQVQNIQLTNYNTKKVLRSKSGEKPGIAKVSGGGAALKA